MYAIIYEVVRDGDSTANTIRQILNSNIDEDAWNPGDSNLEYQNATDEADVITKLNLLDEDWKANFETVYIKK